MKTQILKPGFCILIALVSIHSFASESTFDASATPIADATALGSLATTFSNYQPKSEIRLARAEAAKFLADVPGNYARLEAFVKIIDDNEAALTQKLPVFMSKWKLAKSDRQRAVLILQIN